jgi:hypothetical protein
VLTKILGTYLTPGIIFRGKGQIDKAERNKYHKNVEVFFQASAWADRKVCVKWVDTVLASSLGKHNFN